MKRILIALAAVIVFFMTSVVPFVPTADAWSPRPWTPKPWELREWKPEPPAELKEWKPNSTEMKKWELQQWVLAQHEMVSWELNNNPDLTAWEVKNYELIAWELEQWNLELQGQGGSPSGGLDGNTSANSPPVQGPQLLPPDEVSVGEDPDASGEGDVKVNSDKPTEEQVQEQKEKEEQRDDAIKFVAKDVIGGTVNFSDEIIRANEADAMGKFTSYQKGLLYSGAKVVTKGNDFFESTFMLTDVADETKKTVEAFSNLNQLREIRTLTQAGRIDDALQLTNSVKTFSTTNAIVSTALLPIAVWDTWDKASKIEGTTGWDRADAIVDTIGSAGGIISGLAAPVAMIPGGQVIAAGMLAVGAVLSLGSVAYKAARNWRKIKDTAVNTVKSVGDGIKKIGSTIGSWFK